MEPFELILLSALGCVAVVFAYYVYDDILQHH